MIALLIKWRWACAWLGMALAYLWIYLQLREEKRQKMANSVPAKGEVKS
jgi:hypothetical protein